MCGRPMSTPPMPHWSMAPFTFTHWLAALPSLPGSWALIQIQTNKIHMLILHSLGTIKTREWKMQAWNNWHGPVGVAFDPVVQWWLQLQPLNNCHLNWIYSIDTWTQSPSLKPYQFEMWDQRKITKIRWVNKVTNGEVLQKVQESRDIPDTVKQCKQR